MSKKPPAPTITYTPPPPPPAPPTKVPTQSLQTQLALNESSAAQQRLNMELGAQLDRTNAEFFTGQDVRRYQAQGTEERLGIATTGEQQRFGIAASGEQQRETIGRTAEEQRTTDLQQEMFRRYKEDRDYTQAQQQYRT
jgi:hypothetical protein